MATTSSTPISPLRQRMQHDMMMRGLSPRTQHKTEHYVGDDSQHFWRVSVVR